MKCEAREGGATENLRKFWLCGWISVELMTIKAALRFTTEATEQERWRIAIP